MESLPKFWNIVYLPLHLCELLICKISELRTQFRCSEQAMCGDLLYIEHSECAAASAEQGLNVI